MNINLAELQDRDLRPWDSGSRHCWMLCFTVFCIPSSQSDRLRTGSTAL